MEDQRCPTHGESMVRLGSRLACPACLASKTEYKVVELAERTKAASERKVVQIRRASGIPYIYQNANLQTLDLPQDEAAKASFVRVAKAMDKFSSNFSRFRREFSGFLFSGISDTGKTHMACAVANRLMEAGYAVMYASLPSIMVAVRASYGSEPGRESVQQIIARHSRVDLLILDEIDLHGEGMGDFQVIYEILNNRYSSGFRPTIAISNRSKEYLIKDLGDRIVKRICGTSPEVSFEWTPFNSGAQNNKAARI